jgi:3-oxoacyl-[acyl-carrier protein] reductase
MSMSDPNHTPYDLQGKVAIVAGGSRGIGRAISERLAREGAAVVVNYVSNGAAAEETVQAIKQGGGRSLAVKADIISRRRN